MPVKAGQIVIDISAGTSKMVLDLENAKGKLREFGSSGTSALRGLGDAGHGAVSGVQATSGALRVFEGNMTNNLRASERFLANTLHLGPVLQAAFPVIGGIAFGGMLVELGEKVYNFFKTAAELPTKMENAFRELNEPLKLTNDQLLVTNDRLANDIAKLEGKRQNTLKLSLDEARVAADHLAESLEKDLRAVEKILKENNVGFMQRFFGQAGTSDLKEEFGEKNRQEINDINDRGQFAVDKAATNPNQKIALRDVEAAQKAWDTELLKHYGDQLKEVNKLIGESYRLKGQDSTFSLHLPSFYGKDFSTKSAGSDLSLLPSTDDERTRLHGLIGLRQQFELERDQVTNRAANTPLVNKKDGLEAGAEAARKYAEELKRLRDEVIKSKEASLAWDEVIDAQRDKELRDIKERGTSSKETRALVNEAFDNKIIIKYLEISTKLKNELGETRKEFQKIGVESRKAFGEFFKTEIEASTKTLDEHAKAVTKLGEEYNKLTQQTGAQNLQHKVSMVTAGGDHGDPLGALAQQQALQAADIQKRYEGSLVAINSRLAELWREQLRTLSQITGVDQAHVNVEAIGNINLEKANLLRERNLQLLALQNEMEQKTAEVRQKGVGDFFKDMQGQAQTVGNIFYESMHSGLDQISDQFAKLMTGQKTSFGKMFQDLGEQMLKSSIKSGLQKGLGKLGEAFGIHAKADGSKENPWHAICDNLPQGSSGTQSTMPTDLFNTMQPSNNMGALTAGLSGAGGGIGGFLSGLFGGGGGAAAAGAAGPIEDVSSTFLPMMAEGGDVDPGHSYIVGENAPEMFTPRSSGTITPMHKMGGTVNNHHSYTIDARGAQLGTENRIAAAISAAHDSAVTNSIRAGNERSKRTPQRHAA